MRFSNLLTLGAVVAAVSAAPKSDDFDGIEYDEVYDNKEHDVQLRFMKNSGVCETTKGVDTYSGYITVAPNAHYFFWFFESRNNPEEAPLATWFNGGPGCSSMIGLFQENGPCQFYNGDDTPSINNASWNEVANMLYIDSPVGAGFSYGSNDPVKGTDDAAVYVWKFLQTWFKRFPKYKSRDFGLFTESYGGHYGPAFTYHIEEQNKKIKQGTIKGEKIDLIALGINNGIYDVGIQTKAYIEYMYDNPYRQLIDKATHDRYLKKWKNKCVPAAAKCTSTATDEQIRICAHADAVCGAATPNGNVQFDVYDIRKKHHVNVPETYAKYINTPAMRKKIGAKSGFSECSSAAGNPFYRTGDEGRTYLPDMSSVIQSGIQVIMWAGDADWICNYVGNYEVAQRVEFDQQSAFRQKKPKPYKVNGKEQGLFKTAGNLSWLQVYNAGHEVPFYQPETALQVFRQTMSKKSLHST